MQCSAMYVCGYMRACLHPFICKVRLFHFPIVEAACDFQVILHQSLLDAHLGRGKLERSVFKKYFRTVTQVPNRTGEWDVEKKP